MAWRYRAGTVGRRLYATPAGRRIREDNGDRWVLEYFNQYKWSGMPGKRILDADERDRLLETLQHRFSANMNRHKGVRWEDVRARLESTPDKLWSLGEMERTGGEPDVLRHDGRSGEFFFVDCAKESPKGRRSLCYDHEALEARKKHKPEYSAVRMASDMGTVLLTEEEYRSLQRVGPFDTTTSSWLLTPPEIRKLGGAIFGDFRYGTVFVYHNGAESYYAARGFRCSLRV